MDHYSPARRLSQEFLTWQRIKFFYSMTCNQKGARQALSATRIFACSSHIRN